MTWQDFASLMQAFCFGGRRYHYSVSLLTVTRCMHDKLWAVERLHELKFIFNLSIRSIRASICGYT